jgi:hypothetical protein
MPIGCNARINSPKDNRGCPDHQSYCPNGSALKSYSDTILPRLWRYREFSARMPDTMHDACDPLIKGKVGRTVRFGDRCTCMARINAAWPDGINRDPGMAKEECMLAALYRQGRLGGSQAAHVSEEMKKAALKYQIAWLATRAIN